MLVFQPERPLPSQWSNLGASRGDFGSQMSVVQDAGFPDSTLGTEKLMLNGIYLSSLHVELLSATVGTF